MGQKSIFAKVYRHDKTTYSIRIALLIPGIQWRSQLSLT